MPAQSTGSTVASTAVARLTGHNGPVHALTYSSAEAQYILTGCADRTIRLYNPAKASTHEQAPGARPAGLVQTYNGHGYEVLDIAVAPDNARFASVGGDKQVLLWDVAKAQVLRRWEGHSGRCNTVAWGGLHDEGGVVISGSFDTTVKLWDTKSNNPKPIMTLSDAKDSISCLVVVDAEILAGCTDGRVRTYDIRMGRLTTDVIGNPVTSLKPTRRNDAYLVSALESPVQLMDKSSGKLLQSFARSSASHTTTSSSASSASSTSSTAHAAHHFRNSTYRLRSCLAANDTLALSGAEDGRVWVWDVLSGQVVQEVWHAEAFRVAATVTAAAAAAAGGDGAAGGDAEEKTRSKRSVVSCVRECPVREEWCSAGGDGVVVVWASRDD